MSTPCERGHRSRADQALKHLVVRSDALLSPEQRWCGTWYDCPFCRFSVLVQSAELQAQLAQQRANLVQQSGKAARTKMADEVAQDEKNGVRGDNMQFPLEPETTNANVCPNCRRSVDWGHITIADGLIRVPCAYCQQTTTYRQRPHPSIPVIPRFPRTS